MKQKLTKQDTNFTQIKNSVLEDKDLSWKAKGIYCYLFSKPNNWDFSGYRITEDSKDGKYVTFQALKELEENNYLIRKRLSSGKVEYYINWDKKPNPNNCKQGKKPNPNNCKYQKLQIAKISTISNKEYISNKEKKVIKKHIKKRKKSLSSLKRKNDSTIPSPFNAAEYIQKMKKDKRLHIRIIATYLSLKNKQKLIKTKEVMNRIIHRNVKVARLLASYDKKIIEKAIAKTIKSSRKNGFRWTLETVLKLIET